MNKTLKACLATVGFMTGMAGTGIDDAHALEIFCPTSVTAHWIQAANGKTNVINKFSSRVTDATTSRLACSVDGLSSTDKIEQRVNVGRNAPQLCTAKVTFIGFGETRDGVPPFEAFEFKSNRLTATATYNNSTGDCLLQLLLRPTLTEEVVSHTCTKAKFNSWNCPSLVHPVSVGFEEGGDLEIPPPTLRELLPGMTHYDIFEASRLASRSRFVDAGPRTGSWLEEVLGS